jgi:hypothetical protein
LARVRRNGNVSQSLPQFRDDLKPTLETRARGRARIRARRAPPIDR